MTLIILVTGGREYQDSARVAEELSRFSKLGNVLLNGGARGADFLARQYWHKTAELPYITVPAAWSRSARAAGMVRNMTMVVGNSIAPHGKLVPDVVLAFPGGRGTNGTVEYALERGVEVVYSADWKTV